MLKSVLRLTPRLCDGEVIPKPQWTSYKMGMAYLAVATKNSVKYQSR